MRKMFLVLSIMLAVVTTQASIYAIEISIGGSAGFAGMSKFRGSDANEFASKFEKEVYYTGLPTVQLDVMVEVLPFLAVETSIGYIHRKIVDYDDVSFPDGFPFDKGNMVFLKHGFTLPIMLRFQYEFKRVLIYTSVGPKLFIPISDYVDSSLPDDYLEGSDFVLDLGIALGVEFRIGDANYLGLRAAYDLNLISPLESIGGNTDHNFRNDNFGASLTYRYAFGSKWKK